MPNYCKLGSFKVRDKAVEFFAVPPGKGNMEEKQQLLAAYRWVTGCGNQSEANMEVEMKECRGILIPILRNKVDLSPFTQLTKHVPAAKPAQPVVSQPKQKAARTST